RLGSTSATSPGSITRRLASVVKNDGTGAGVEVFTCGNPSATMATRLARAIVHFATLHPPCATHIAVASDSTTQPNRIMRHGYTNLTSGSLHTNAHGNGPTRWAFTTRSGPSEARTASPNTAAISHAARLRLLATRNAASTARSGMPTNASCDALGNRFAAG